MLRSSTCLLALLVSIAGCGPASETDAGLDAPGLDAPDAPGSDTGDLDAGSDAGDLDAGSDLDAPAIEDAPSAPDAPGPVTCDGPPRTGDATAYTDVPVTGHCSLPPTTDFFAAMNAPDWEGSAVCGTCVEITGPLGSVVARVVDQCPGCSSGDVDLSTGTFAEIAEVSVGRVAVTWREVPCPVTGGVVIAVDPSANPFYLAVSVRNHRHRLATVERRLADDTWVPLARRTDNIWVESPVTGAPVSSMHLRVTDVLGSSVEADLAVTGSLEVTTDQLPLCGG